MCPTAHHNTPLRSTFNLAGAVSAPRSVEFAQVSPGGEGWGTWGKPISTIPEPGVGAGFRHASGARPACSGAGWGARWGLVGCRVGRGGAPGGAEWRARWGEVERRVGRGGGGSALVRSSSPTAGPSSPALASGAPPVAGSSPAVGPCHSDSTRQGSRPSAGDRDKGTRWGGVERPVGPAGRCSELLRRVALPLARVATKVVITGYGPRTHERAADPGVDGASLRSGRATPARNACGNAPPSWW